MSGTDSQTRVAVIGGGAVGVTAAYDLARRGADVTLYEKDEIAGGSTGRAAGVLYDAFASPEDARVGDRAVERFREFSGEGDFEFRETPYVWFAREGDERRADAIREQVPRMRDAGRDVSFADREELRERFPAVNWRDVGVAAIAENAGHTDPESYADLLAEKASEAGAAIRIGVEADFDVDALAVEGVKETGGDGASAESFDAILVAAKDSLSLPSTLPSSTASASASRSASTPVRIAAPASLAFSARRSA